MSGREAVLIITDDTSLRLQRAIEGDFGFKMPINVEINGEKFVGYVRRMTSTCVGIEVHIVLPSKECRIEPIAGIETSNA